jgi:hypothetical protein
MLRRRLFRPWRRARGQGRLARVAAAAAVVVVLAGASGAPAWGLEVGVTVPKIEVELPTGEVGITPTVEATVSPTVEATTTPKLKVTAAPTVEAKASITTTASSSPTSSGQTTTAGVTTTGEASVGSGGATKTVRASASGAPIASSGGSASGSSTATRVASEATAAGHAAIMRGGGGAHAASTPHDPFAGPGSGTGGGFATGPKELVDELGRDAFSGLREGLANEPIVGAPEPPGGSSVSDGVLGVHVPPELEQGALLATLTILGGLLLIGLVLADAAGIGPRHAEWRARFAYRLWH